MRLRLPTHRPLARRMGGQAGRQADIVRWGTGVGAMGGGTAAIWLLCLARPRSRHHRVCLATEHTPLARSLCGQSLQSVQRCAVGNQVNAG